MRQLLFILISLAVMVLSPAAGCSGDGTLNGGKTNNDTNNNGGDDDDNGGHTTFTTQLGANFNENIDQIPGVAGLIHSSRMEWVRAFVNIPNYFLRKSGGAITGIKDQAFADYTATQDFINIKKASTNGLKTIMSFKIPFEAFDHKVPEAESEQMGYVIEACRRFLVLHDLGRHIDILVMGNEPMWENGGNPENYRNMIHLMAKKLDEWKKEYGWDFKVFTGSLNRISIEADRNPFIPGVIAEVNENPLIDGLDLHLHVADFGEIGASLKLTRETLGVKKDIIVTEYSMVWVFGPHLKDNLGQWGVNHGYASDMKMYQWLNNAVAKAKAGTPISPEEFSSFFETKQWYSAGWYKKFYDEFVEYNVLAATGRFSCVAKPTDAEYDTSTTMWDLNAIYSSKYMGVDPSTGFMNPSPLVYPDYMEIYKEKFGN